MKDKETYLFSKPQGFRTIRFHLAAEAIEWLDGTTKDDDDNAIGNHTLFYNLLSRMRLILFATMERLDLIAVSSTKVASVASVTCIEGWTDRQGSYVGNPYHTAPNGI